MKNITLYLVVFVLAYLVFTIANLPAKFVLAQVNLPKNIHLQHVSGTIWHANIKQINTDKLTIHDVNAKLSLVSLITMSPSVLLEFGDAMKFGPVGQLTLIKQGDGFVIEDANIDVAANDLLANANLPVPVVAKGDLTLKLSEFLLGKPLCSVLQGQLTWPKAQVKALEEKVKLGSLKATLSCEKGAIALTLDEKNDLGLSYTAYMRQWGKFTGDGFVKPSDKFPPQLKPILNFLGKPDNQGRYRLSL